MNIGITIKYPLNDPHDFVGKAVKYLRKRKVKVYLCPKACKLLAKEDPGMDFGKKYDALIVFGGDGALLRTVQSLKNFNTPVLPINMGRLGFLSEVLGKNYQAALDKILQGRFLIEKRMMLRCTVARGKRKAFSKRALNEVTIARDALARMVSLKTTINDLKLTTYVADGLIISTPTGSTGYSISAGGPVVSPGVDSMILTPISPHSFTQKPIILHSSSRAKVFIPASQNRVYLTVDGQIGFHLKDDDIVKIKKSSKSLKLIRFNKNSYFQTLRKKLNWGHDLAGRV